MKRNQFKTYLFSVLSAALIISCTNLEIEETDSIISPTNPDGTTFNGVSDPVSALTGVYLAIGGNYGNQENEYALAEVTTDEFLVPTRGTDWGDNGLWRVLHQHAWNFEHQFIGNAWNQWNTTQLLAAEIIDPKSNASAVQVAEAKFLRALSQYHIVDLWGIVPVRDLNLPPSVLPEVLDGTTATARIIQDLEEAITALPAGGPGSTASTRTANKSTARYLLAKVLLNKHVFTSTPGEAIGSPDPADMQRVITLVDAITADGYALEDDYFDIFRQTADSETIFSIPNDVGPRIWNTLHYNMAPEITGGGWNGFSTLAEFYDLFEGNPNSNVVGGNQEERRGGVPLAGLPVGADPAFTDSNNDGFGDGTNVGFGFLIGQQYNYDGTPLNDRGGAPLTFKREFTDGTGAKNLQNNDETTGIRVIKYGPRYGGFAGHQVVFRYADAYLMKAEAMLRSGGDPTLMVNNLRALRDADPLASVNAQELLNERGRELYGERWRRNDLIRFGQYLRDWDFKDPSAVGNVNRRLFPIPASQLITNPNLVQNPGY